MDADDLRAAQAPLKEQYRADPDSAATPVHARADFRDPGVSCTVGTWAGPVRAGLHRATGGDGSEACSGDMLLEALLACAGVTLRSVATAYGVEIRSAELAAEATFDSRGTLGLSRDVPVGVGQITVTARLDTDADDAALAKLATATERFCVVGQSLGTPPRIEVQRSST